MRRAFDIEDINLDELIATAMEDPQARRRRSQGSAGTELRRPPCQLPAILQGRDSVDPSPVDLGRGDRLLQRRRRGSSRCRQSSKASSFPGVSIVLDGEGKRFAEVYEPDHRRMWVPLSDIPMPVQQAFVAAEDKRFYQHRGVDERGVIRAFMSNMAKPGRPAGGSTITQQVAKNLLVGDDVTYERKMREMIVASRIERTSASGDPRDLPELDLSRTRLLGRRNGGQELFRKARQVA